MGEHQPIPVVFNLSSWAANHSALDQWLIEELHIRYDVPRSIGQQWLASNELLPLLDGLDEVTKTHRADCVKAINTFRRDHGLIRFAVCSRTNDYTTLTTLLQVEEALELQPPTHQQVHDYLVAAGSPLAAVQAALNADPTLWELLASPLVLNIVALTYQDQPADALRTTGTPAQRLTLLFTAYTERMLTYRASRYGSAWMLHWLSWLARSMQRRSQSEFDLDRLQLDWLPTPVQRRLVTLVPAVISGLVGGLVVWLIFGLVHGRVAEWLAGLSVGPIAAWLGARIDVVGLVAGLVFALVTVIGGRTYEPVRMFRGPWLGLGVGLSVGLAAGPTAGLLFGLSALGVGRIYESVRADGLQGAHWFWPELRRGLSGGLVGGLAVGLMARLVVELLLAVELLSGLAVGMVNVLVIVGLIAMSVGPVYGLVRGDGKGALATINPVEELHWSWSGSLTGLVFGSLTGLIFGLGVGLGTGLGNALISGLSNVLVIVLRYGLITGLAVGLSAGLVNGLISGLDAGLAENRVTPNEGIRRSRRHGLVVGLVVGLIVGLAVGLLSGLAYGRNSGLVLGLGVGLTFGVGFGLIYGLSSGLELGGIAYLRHLTLRGLLVYNRAGPWRYVDFLNDATERLFLRQTGSGYIFVHRLLLEHFASLEATPPAKVEQSAILSQAETLPNIPAPE